jgi:hypothetical protein
MEVQVAWLDIDEPSEMGQSQRPPHQAAMAVEPDRLEDPPAAPDSERVAPPSSRRKPPRLPGATRTLPPMPIVPTTTQHSPPRRNHTMEVEMSWLELLEEKKTRAPEEGERLGKNGSGPRPLPVEEATKPLPKERKPIPREED